MLSQSQELSCSIVHENRGATTTYLPRAEDFLDDLPDEKKKDLFQVLWSMSEMPPAEFWSELDVVLVALFPATRDSCLKFYKNEGPDLGGLLCSATLERLDAMLLRALRLA